jgi:hypothetical protein
MWAGLDNYDAFSVGVDQLFIVTIELIPVRGDFKACFILKIEVLTLLLLVLVPSFCFSLFGVSCMMGVRSKRTIATAHAWVLTSSTIVFAKGHLRGQTVSKWRQFGEKGHFWLSDHSVCYFLKIIKFWPQIREPCV